MSLLHYHMANCSWLSHPTGSEMRGLSGTFEAPPPCRLYTVQQVGAILDLSENLHGNGPLNHVSPASRWKFKCHSLKRNALKTDEASLQRLKEEGTIKPNTRCAVPSSSFFKEFGPVGTRIDGFCTLITNVVIINLSTEP